MSTNSPNPGLGLAVLRAVTGVIYVAHGAHKLFIGGVDQTAGFLGQLGVPLSTVTAWGLTLLEVFGGLALIAGLAVTPLALLLIVYMLAGIVLVHAGNGFYVIGPGQGGVEFNLLLIAALAALVLAGPGAAAADGALGSSGRGAEPGAGGA